MKNVLVLCTGNSCRSIMAEGLINHFGKGRYCASSAGSFPTGYVHPKSLAILERHGIVVDKPRSKSWNELEHQNFDLLISVCDEAAGETCPAYLQDVERLHWSTPDPAKAEGSDTEIEAAFEAVYQMLKQRLEKELL